MEEDDLIERCETELFLDDLGENWTLLGVLGDAPLDNELGDGELLDGGDGDGVPDLVVIVFLRDLLKLAVKRLIDFSAVPATESLRAKTLVKY